MEVCGAVHIGYGSTNSVIKLYNFSDIHLLHKGVAIKRLRKDIAKVKREGSLWLIGGDMAEYISPQDKRFDCKCVDPKLHVSDFDGLAPLVRHMIFDLFSPIKETCIGIGYGNHEYQYYTHNAQGWIHDEICADFGCLNLGYCGMFDLVFVQIGRSCKVPIKLQGAQKGRMHTKFRVVVHHGAGWAQSPGGKINKLIQGLHIFPGADVFMTGHLHDQKAVKLQGLDANEDCTKLVDSTRVAVMSGTYLPVYIPGVTSYGERKMFMATPLGPSYVSFKPWTREINAEV